MVRNLLISLLVFAVACGSKETPENTAPGADSNAEAPAAAGIDLEGIDRKVKPGDDFFAFANGAWLARTEIPADRSNWGTGAILTELTSKRVAELIRDAAKNAPSGSDARKVGDFFSTYMNEATIESKGLAPLQPAIDRIASIADPAGLASYLGGTVRADVDALNNTNFQTPNIFGLWVAQDLSDPSHYSPFLLQGGLGMPSRDYYLGPAPRMVDYRMKYEAHLAKVFDLAGQPDGSVRAKRVVDLEKRIAMAHITTEDNGDVQRGNNRWTRGDFDQRAPGMPWTLFFDAMGLGAQNAFVVWQPTAVTGIAAAVKDVPLATWKDYLTARAIERAAPVLPKAFVEENFAFYGGVLAGTPALAERWKRAVDATSDALGEAVGRLYVEKYFPAPQKERATKMVGRIMAAFDRRIDKLEWMNSSTKQQAKAKLAVLKVGVGYPDAWRDYGALSIVKADALGNAERASLFEYRRNLAKLGQPVDRGEWAANPQLVNAGNLPAMNAMNFPAAILQPPYFDPKRPEVMDYGAIGALIGHEISHSFDDQGALFDSTGKLENWWTPEDFKHFQASSAKLVAQYNAYKPFPDLAVNGKLTLSENIADVAGLAAAYDAYRFAQGGKEAPSVQGLTGDQQFFLSFAQSWRGKFREPALRRRVLINVHAPFEYRADTVRNLDAWYAAFQSSPGDRLYLAPADRVRVW